MNGLREVIRTKHVITLDVMDPDTRLPVTIEIRKLETGALVGLDGAFLEQLCDEDMVFSPYEEGVRLIVPDNEETISRYSRY